MGKLLIYGANGYTGRLCAKLAAERGVPHLLGGRNREALEEVARASGAEVRVFGLDDPSALDRGLEGVSVVLHCAGPFSRTAAAMFEACVRAKAHYLDITGEIEVFEKLAARSKEAEGAGIMAMPGAGFDVVPSDCLAQHLKQRLPSATHLEMGFALLGGVSHGTATTMTENLHRGSAVREDGKIRLIPMGSQVRQIDFGRGPRPAVAIPWGDVSTAWHSTGIPNITVYAGVPRGVAVGMRAMSGVTRFLGKPGPQALIKRWLKARPAGPNDEQRAKGRSILWGEVHDAAGRTAAARLTTLEGYTLTAITALDIAQRALGGDLKVGFQTPSMAYGAGLILGVPGTTLTDL